MGKRYKGGRVSAESLPQSFDELSHRLYVPGLHELDDAAAHNDPVGNTSYLFCLLRCRYAEADTEGLAEPAFLIPATNASKSAGSLSRAPVTPVTETR